MNLIKDVKEELTTLDSSKKKLKQFKILMLVVSVILFSLGLFIQNNFLLYFSPVLFLIILMGVIIQSWAKYIYIGWMTFAFVLGWIMSRVILILVFYLLVTPIGLVGKMVNKKFLDIKISESADTYWVKKPSKNIDYKKMS